jgi:hypothetical protein
MGLNPEQFHGKNDVDVIFKGHPLAPTPFPHAGGRKDKQSYDPDRVREAITHPSLSDVDPRTVHSTQPSVTRAGVSHYLENTEVYKDPHNAGNRHPVVYDRDDGRRLLLSGHHRATAALLRGEQFKAVVVPGPWGPAR